MSKLPALRLHAIEWNSCANGPGMRAVFWTQGCTLGCPGCFNPQTHPHGGGTMHPAENLLAELTRRSDLQGITLTGGEPLQQPAAVANLLRLVRTHTDLSVVMFTGYSSVEIGRTALFTAIAGQCDAIIAGRYNHKLAKGENPGLVSSANQELILITNRYQAGDFRQLPEGEVWIAADGSVSLSGVSPLVVAEPAGDG